MRRVFGLALALSCLAACGSGTSLKINKMPDNGTFTGVFFSPQYGEMQMVQNGNAVVGKYKKDERSGRIQGEVDGDVLRFEWTEYKAMVSNRPQATRGHGYFRYMIDPGSGDHIIKGRWGLGDDDANGGDWNAYKSKTRQPDLESFHVGNEGAEGDESSGAGSDESSDDSSGSSSSDDEDDNNDDFF